MTTQTKQPKRHIFALVQAPVGMKAPGLMLISGQPYAIIRQRPDPKSGCVCLIRVEKLRDDMQPDGHYNCALLGDGREDCDCADFEFRARTQGKACKHLDALRRFKLLTPPESAEAKLREALKWIVENCRDGEAQRVAWLALSDLPDGQEAAKEPVAA